MKAAFTLLLLLSMLPAVHALFFDELISFFVSLFCSITFGLFCDENPQTNDQCTKAIEMQVNETVQGTSTSVGDTLEGTGGAWYSIQGTGGYLTASTCTGDNTLDTNEFDSIIHVDYGECSLLLHTGENDNGGICGNGKSELTWFSDANEIYYINVYDFFGSTGSFGLTVYSSLGQANEQCTEAIEMQVGDTVQGTSTGFGNFIEGTGGAWYSIQGTGGYLTASTCTGDNTLDTNEFDSIIHVDYGACSNLLHTGEDDDGGICGNGKSELTWFSDANEIYFINVHDFFGSTGSFGLTVYSSLGPNSDCFNATELELDTISVGTSSDEDGVWYSFPGNGAFLAVSTCTGNSTLDETFFDSIIEVNSGDCDSLQFVDTDDEGGSCGNGKSTVYFQSLANETYYIRVYDFFGFSSGSFGITIYEIDLPPNDECEDAITVELNEIVEGDFSSEFVSDGYWYTFAGTGGFLAFSTCTGNEILDNTTLDTFISLDSGSCDNLESLEFNSNGGSCGNGKSTVVFQSVANEIYYASVFASFGTGGPFGVTLFEITVPPNAECVDAIALKLDEIVAGETSIYHGGSVWYSLVGTGDTLAVSTCTGNSTLDNTDFDSVIDVFVRDCEDLRLIESDDESGGCGNAKSTVIFRSVANVTYTIQVREYNGKAGMFGLTAYLNP